MAELVYLEREGRLAWIVLNRPEALNAINNDLARGLLAACVELRADPEVWAVAIRSTSERAFSVGADIKERATFGPEDWRRQRALFVQMFAAVRAIEQPCIAAVDGYALGGGLEIALGADFIVATDRAELGLPEVRLGIIPGGGGTQHLPRRVGTALAKELIFTGRRIGAAEALRIGLVNRVVPPAELLPTVRAIAGEILANAPVAVRAAKRAIEYGAEVDLRTGLAIEAEAYQVALQSEDRAEGIRAFNEKRRPEFRNR